MIVSFHPSVVLLLLSLIAGPVCSKTYVLELLEPPSKPVLSFVDGSSAFQQVFNPSWITGEGTGGRTGLLVRAQNCTATVGGGCPRCEGGGPATSVLAFAQHAGNDTFARVTNASVVFSPQNALEMYGTEDPRILFNPADRLYYLFYTCYGQGNSVLLCLATSPDPTKPDLWTRYGAVFSAQNGKAGALWLQPDPASPLSYLLWGSGQVNIASTDNLLYWPDQGQPLISSRSDYFDSQGIESGPPPLPLSDGTYLFFYNSWNSSMGFQPGYVILDPSNPGNILQRSATPLFDASGLPWALGVPPYTCNVPDVIFLEAAVQLGPDVFRVYFGGSDAVVGTALFKVSIMA